MICSEEVPLQFVLGKEIGAMYMAEHEAAGVKVHANILLKKINVNEENEMQSLEFTDGSTLEADFVIMATGVVPATKILEGTDIEMGSRG
jgi:nitrite reductase (NADH) large subunit